MTHVCQACGDPIGPVRHDRALCSDCETRAPLRFDVRSVDGRLLDSFTEDELATVAAGLPGKAWQEAAAWAVLAIDADRRRRT